jgi:membrane-bound ClpP family serine protease
MKLIAEYFGILVFGFVVLVAGLVVLPPNVSTQSLPATSMGEIIGFGLAFLVIAGGFTWYYNAELPADEPSQQRGRESDRRR